MLMRLLPLIGGLLLSRGSRRMAGRHAGKLTLALSAWELWRAYKSRQAPIAPQDPQARSPQPGVQAKKTVRRRKRFL